MLLLHRAQLLGSGGATAMDSADCCRGRQGCSADGPPAEQTRRVQRHRPSDLSPQPVDGESLAGYVLRAAIANGYLSCPFSSGFTYDAGTSKTQPLPSVFKPEVLTLSLAYRSRRWRLPQLPEKPISAFYWTKRTTRYCPRCLISRPGVHLNWWTALGATVCPRHKVLLHDRCPCCSNPVSLEEVVLGFCNCGARLGGDSPAAPPDLTAAQTHYCQVLERGMRPRAAGMSASAYLQLCAEIRAALRGDFHHGGMPRLVGKFGGLDPRWRALPLGGRSWKLPLPYEAAISVLTHRALGGGKSSWLGFLLALDSRCPTVPSSRRGVDRLHAFVRGRASIFGEISAVTEWLWLELDRSPLTGARFIDRLPADFVSLRAVGPRRTCEHGAKRRP